MRVTKKWSSSSFYSEGDTSLLSNIRFSDRVSDLFSHPHCFVSMLYIYYSFPISITRSSFLKPNLS